MADFDEYAYLERQLEGGGQQDAAAAPEERRGKDKDRKDRDKSHKRSRSRSRDRDRRRERSPRGDRGGRERGDREKHRDRDLDRDRRDRGGGRHDDRRGGYDRGPGRGGYDRGGPPPDRRKGGMGRERTPPEVRAMKEQEKELREMERSTRTVFAYNLNLKADERDVFEFFSRAGQIMDVKLITDKNTRRSKGFAYIEYSKQEEVLSALSLTGQVFMGQTIMVKSSEAEKNLAWEAQEQAKQNQAAAAALLAGGQPSMLGGLGMPSLGPCKLQVSNLNPQLGESELKDIFEPFGQLDLCQVSRNSGGVSQGFGFVQFSTTADAMAAMNHWNGKTVAGATLNISIVPPAVSGGLPPTLAAAQVAQMQQAPGGLESGIGELDEEEEKGGLKLTSNARQALMQRLASSAGLQPHSAAAAAAVPGGAVVPAAPMPLAYPGMPGGFGAGAPAALAVAGPRIDPNITMEQGLLGPSSPIPTQCLLLKNMFDPQEETSPEWDREIAEDVTSECSKCGQVVHRYVDKNSKGFVYLKFASIEAAAAAQRLMHGRFFASRQIAAEFQFVHAYTQAFDV